MGVDSVEEFEARLAGGVALVGTLASKSLAALFLFLEGILGCLGGGAAAAGVSSPKREVLSSWMSL